MKKVTMQDIANKLNISKSLVSLALNDKYGVSNDVRFNILNTAISLGYDFNYKYKTKNSYMKKRIIVFIKKEAALENPYWADLLKGSEKLLSEENMKFIISLWTKETKKDEFLKEILKGDVEGILVIDEIPQDILESFKKINIPLLFVDARNYLDKDFDNVRTNNYLGGILAAEYLIKMGHKKIAFVGDKDFSISFRERYYGFRNYIEEFKDVTYCGTISQSTYDNAIDFTSESNILKAFKMNERPTALFCANDRIAMFAYDELKKIGLKPYEDVSIIGFDDLKESETLNPPLTSVRVEVKELGKAAVEQLIKRIKYKETVKKSIFLAVDINERKSVRRIE